MFILIVMSLTSRPFYAEKTLLAFSTDKTSDLDLLRRLTSSFLHGCVDDYFFYPLSQFKSKTQL